MSEGLLTEALGEPAAAPLSDWALLGGALLGSAALVWFVSGQPLIAAAYAGGVFALGGIGRVLIRTRAPAPVAEFAQPDWSVTQAAIERADAAVSVTDRAGRLVCANARHQEWFGVATAPPRLALDAASVERLDRAARAAWRDGAASADGLEGGAGRWRAEARRAGRGEDFLIWTLCSITRSDASAEAAQAISGKLGKVLGDAGLQAALVDAAGTVVAANASFVQRATGDAAASVVGSAFVAHLRSDEADRIYFAREGRKGPALRLVHLPLADPDSVVPADPAKDPAAMILLESGVGEGESQAGIPQIEALLSRLPLGLAMCERDGRFLFANEAFLRAAGHDDRIAPPYPSDLVS